MSLAARSSRRAKVCSRSNTVGHDLEFAAVKLRTVHAPDDDTVTARAANLSAAAGQKIAQFGDFGFAGGVYYNRFALGTDSREEYVFGCADGREGEIYNRAAKSVRAAAVQPAVFIGDLRAELTECGNVHINRAGTQFAAAGEAHDAFAAGTEKSAHEDYGRAHPAHEFIADFAACEGVSVDLGTATREAAFAAEGGQYPESRVNVGEFGTAGKADGIAREGAGGEEGENAVFGTLYRKFARKPPPAVYFEQLHNITSKSFYTDYDRGRKAVTKSR